jgi:LysM repeat protein
MFKWIKLYTFTSLTLIILLLNFPVHAKPSHAPDFDISPYDLVDAVNALRVAYGLPPYSLNSILMFTAQNQADFMSATGSVSHSGPGGIGFTDRLLAAGYPLAGDLSAGGFRSENIISGTKGMSAQDAVDAWMGDSVHQNTMLSQNLTEIGAGVSVANGRVYFVIDCAQPKTGGAPPAGTSVVGGGATIPAPLAGTVNEALIYPIVQSTPNANGDVIHEVQSGQTLWQIAITYGVKIDDIKRLNNIPDNNIYPGDKLLIKKVTTLITLPPPLETAIPAMTATVAPSVTLMLTVTVTPTQIPVVLTSQGNKKLIPSMIAILVLALVGGAIFARLGTSEKDKPA